MPQKIRARTVGKADPLIQTMDARRVELGLTEEVLAKRVGVATGTLNRMFNGRRAVQIWIVALTAQALGMELTVQNRSPA